MSQAETIRNTSGASGETPETHYQTESKRSGDYVSTRWNAAKWQLRREDIMVCTGGRCPYRFCELPDEGLPPVGTLCPWERSLASVFAKQVTDLLGSEALQPYIDERPDLLWEWTIAFLLANRASVRLSRASEEIQAASENRKQGTVDMRPFDHAALTMRYLAAAHNRINAIWSELDEILDVALARHREALVRTEMLALGFWNPARGDDAPAIEDAPDWIIEKVDRRIGFGRSRDCRRSIG